MLPTWRDVEIQSELRKVREQEAAAWHTFKQLSEQEKTAIPSLAAALVRLGDWMIVAGEKLHKRYGEVGQADSQLRSLEQGC
jgi:hypothetical protein